MRVSIQGNLYCFADTPYEMREQFVRAGFAWMGSIRSWATPFAEKAGKITNLGQEARKDWERAHALSTATVGQRTYNPDLFPFQNAGVEYITSRPATLLADDPGLGKTAQAIVSCDVWNAMSILVVCPASLKINWVREFQKFSTIQRCYGIASGDFWPDRASDVVIVNYDLLKRYHHQIHDRKWNTIILDEAHYIKGSSQRTSEIVGTRGQGALRAEHKIAITGTPIVNRPIELYNVMKFLCPQAFPNKFKYAARYCDMKKGNWGWDMSGASHLDELQSMLRGAFMLRRLKADVLPQLPAKTRQVIELDPDTGMRKILRREFAVFGSVDADLSDAKYEEIVKRLKVGGMDPMTPIATIRRDAGMAKVNAVIEHIKECLDEEQKVVVFAHHREVIDRICGSFGGACAVVHGGTSSQERQNAVDRFQTDNTCRLFIGNIIAAGVGITLTAASRVVFAESDWVPGNVSQAEDRLHRIGQKEKVLIQHLVIDGSIDAAMAKTLIKKQVVIDQAMNVPEAVKVQEILK